MSAQYVFKIRIQISKKLIRQGCYSPKNNDKMGENEFAQNIFKVLCSKVTKNKKIGLKYLKMSNVCYRI